MRHKTEHTHTDRLTRDAAAAEVDYYPIAYAANNSVFPLAVTEGDPAFSARLCIH